MHRAERLPTIGPISIKVNQIAILAPVGELMYYNCLSSCAEWHQIPDQHPKMSRDHKPTTRTVDLATKLLQYFNQVYS